jgi:hypothetical protein
LCGLCPEYKIGKGRDADFATILQSLGKAEQRAEQQLAARAAEGNEHGAPSTTMFQLTKNIWKKRS